MADSKRYSTLVNNTILFAISNFGSKILSLIIQPYLSYALDSPDVMGVTSLMQSVANLLIPVVSLGVSYAVIRFGLDKSVDKSSVFMNGLATICVGFAMMVLCWPLVRLIPNAGDYLVLIYLCVLMSCLLTLYCYDDKANDISMPNILRQCLQLTVNTPQLAIYSYLAYRNMQGGDLFLHKPQKELSMAENILYLLREDKKFTELEARALDAALILHADHGSNNSTFTNHVVSSTGTDTYSAMAASLCALKGPRHGGANIKVVEMMADLKAHVDDPASEAQVHAYLQSVLDKKALDGLGLIYGMGHAVYSLSDPRAEVLRTFVQDISKEKGLTGEMDLYLTVEKVAKELLTSRTGKPVAVNVDFYSGFLYDMLGLPKELYTPLFAIARMAGWSAHRMEELGENSKIIRPACKCIEKRRPYTPMAER